MSFKHRSVLSHMCQSGYITLLSVLIVGAVGVAIVLSLMLFGIGTARTSFAIEQSNQAKAFANACAEEALEQIRSNLLFSGSGSLSFGQNTCSYAVTRQGLLNTTTNASSTVGTIVRKVKVTATDVVVLTLLTGITITSWQEVNSL